MSTQSFTPEQNAIPSMRAKYDKRGKYDRKTAKVKSGPKPLWVKALTRNGSVRVLEKFDAIATAEQIYAEAWAKRQLALCLQMRTDAQDRAFGKAYTAINPAESKQAATVNNDNRLQNAIINLIPGGTKPAKRKAKLLTAEATVVSTDAATQPSVISDLPADHD